MWLIIVPSAEQAILSDFLSPFSCFHSFSRDPRIIWNSTLVSAVSIPKFIVTSFPLVTYSNCFDWLVVASNFHSFWSITVSIEVRFQVRDIYFTIIWLFLFMILLCFLFLRFHTISCVQDSIILHFPFCFDLIFVPITYI